MSIAFTVLLIGAAILTTTIAFHLMYRGGRSFRNFGRMLLATAWWSAGYALELNSATPESLLIWARLEYIGIVAIPPLWFLFTLQYADLDHRLRPRHYRVLQIAAITTLLLAWTNEWHGLIWSSVAIQQHDRQLTLDITHGVWFYLHTAFSYCLMLIGGVLLIRATLRTTSIYHRHALVLIAGALIPLLGNLVYLLGLNPIADLDLTPLFFAFSGALWFWGVYRDGLLSVAPVARNLVMERIRSAIIVLDAEYRVVDSNEAGRQLFDSGARTIVGRPFTELYPAWKDLAARLSDTAATVVEISLFDQQRQRTFDTHISALVNRRWQPRGYLVVLHDITARKQAEAELAQQKRLFEGLVALAQAATARLTLRDTLHNVLETAISLTGARSGAMALLTDNGAPLQSAIQCDALPTGQEHGMIQHILKSGIVRKALQSRQIAFTNDLSTDTHWFDLPGLPHPVGSVLALPIADQDCITGLLMLCHHKRGHFTSDHVCLMQAAVDQIRLAARNVQLYETQRQLADQAEAANRAKSTFMANVSHELRTPLSTIIGYSEVLTSELTIQGHHEHTADLARITRAGNHLLTLVNDLLDLSLAEAGHMTLQIEPIDVAALATHMAGSIRQLAAQHNNSLTLECADDVGIVYADLAKVQRVIANLLSNACKFTENGAVALKLQVCPSETPGGADPPTHMLCCEVHDTGIGMSAEQIDRLFTRFTQVDSSTTRRYGGLGLGLALSRHLCRLMGGEITIISTPGYGSVVTMQIPVGVAEVTSLPK